MTRRLLVIRHAKSSWDDPAIDDHARVLNERGRDSATALGRWLAEQGLVPDQVLSSDSARTHETVMRMAAEWPALPEITWLPALYHAAPAVLWQVLGTATGQTVALVGHNPGIGDFASEVLRDRPEHDAFWRYPTGATLVAEFDCADWSEARPGMAEARAFVVPRDLIG